MSNMNMNLDTFSSSTEVASFNLSGMKYQVSRSLLDQHPKTMLARCASSQWLADPNSEIFLDRDGYVFRHVLNYLRDGEVILPITVSKNAIINELTYYGIDIADSSIQVCQQASVHGAMAINKLILSLEKDEICIRFTKICIDTYKCKGHDNQLQFFVRFDSTESGKPHYDAAESVAEGGDDMLQRCNRYMESFGMVLKSVTTVEVLRHRPKFSVLLEIFETACDL